MSPERLTYNPDLVRVVDHAVVRNSLGMLRDKETPLESFRFHANLICKWLFSAAIRDLPMQARDIETPLAKTKVEAMDGEVVVMPILRAGIAMLPGALEALPTARVGFVGLERDEKTAVAREYYWKLPAISDGTTVIITDPMLATGGSIWHVLDRLKTVESAGKRIVTVVTAPEGIARIQEDFPEVLIYTAAIDKRLNDQKFIVPGLDCTY